MEDVEASKDLGLVVAGDNAREAFLNLSYTSGFTWLLSLNLWSRFHLILDYKMWVGKIQFILRIKLAISQLTPAKVGVQQVQFLPLGKQQDQPNISLN